MKNIIFLDIDEVLCTVRSRAAHERISAFDQVNCRLLYDVCKTCACKIVLHSTWRLLDEGFEEFKKELFRVVPKFEKGDFLYEGEKACTNKKLDKVDSIRVWLEQYENEEQVLDYIIIDDSRFKFNDENKHLEEHFIRIKNPDVGFSLKEYKECFKYFGTDK